MTLDTTMVTDDGRSLSFSDRLRLSDSHSAGAITNSCQHRAVLLHEIVNIEVIIDQKIIEVLSNVELNRF